MACHLPENQPTARPKHTLKFEEGCARKSGVVSPTGMDDVHGRFAERKKGEEIAGDTREATDAVSLVNGREI